ncbi:MAG: phosphoenolpyruvate mutase [Lentisphaeria bacterium]|nr:phosphoenolpyruvate mutase [Lentisphaeria bacterium]
MKTVYLDLTGDFIHPGIINIIRCAARYGHVVVGLNTDAAVIGHKRMPVLTYEQRYEVVRNLAHVHRVVPQDEWSCVGNLRKYRPDYVIHGDDWKSGPALRERNAVFAVMKELGGEVIEIPYTPGYESSVLAKRRMAYGTLPGIRLAALRRLLAAKKTVRILEVHSGLSGQIAEQLEVVKEDGVHAFDGMWSSSLTSSVNKGKPDIEAVDLTNRLQELNDILETTTKPVIFDGDTGGLPEHFAFAVRTLERNGVSAVIIEDKMGLKQNSLWGTEVAQHLAPVEAFCNKIRQGKAAQVSDAFMIFARLEGLIAGGSVDAALERGTACVEAGADGIMIHSRRKSGEDIREFCMRFREAQPGVPLVAVPTTYNQVTERELASWGVNIVIYANHMLRAAYPAMQTVARRILECERSLEVDDLCMPIRDILELIPYQVS